MHARGNINVGPLRGAHVRPDRIAELDREGAKDVIRNATRNARHRLRLNGGNATPRSVLDAVRQQMQHWCPDIPDEEIEEVVAEAMAALPAGRPAG